MIGRLVIVRMPVRMIPDDRNTDFGKRTVITSSYRIFPGAVIRFQLQTVFSDILFQPIPKDRVGSCVEINDLFGLLRFVVTANHVKVQIAFDLRQERTSLYKIFRAKQSFFFSIPKSKDYISFGLLSTG